MLELNECNKVIKRKPLLSWNECNEKSDGGKMKDESPRQEFPLRHSDCE